MKSFAVLMLTIATIGCLGQAVDAKEYKVQNIGQQGLKDSCARGGGTFVETEGGYHCNYKNGNTRECSKSSKECVVITPARLEADPDGPSNTFGNFTPVGVVSFN